MRVAAIQHTITWADRDANFSHLRPMITEAAQSGARLIVMSELFSTGFVVDRADIGEPENGPTSQFLQHLAQELDVWICGSCPETTEGDSRPFNSLVVAHPTGDLSRYRKIHRFSYGGEDTHYRAGSSHLTLTVDDLRVSFFVCYDLRFADEFWTLAPDTDLYVIPANWPVQRREHWLALLQARAIENQAFVIGCNRVGDGGGQSYSGDSRIFDPLGRIIAEASDNETTLYATVSAETVASTRNKFPFLQDRR